jgi:hypothetical protein
MAQPSRRLLLITLDAHSLDEADAEIEGGDEIAGRRCLLEPSRNSCWVLRVARSLRDEVGQIHLRRLVSGIAGDTQQACCLTFILWDTSAGEIERGQCACGALVPRFGGTAVPACCFHVVRRQRTASDATIAQQP